MIKEPYNNTYGLWQVTTEGDCEGRSVCNLGVYEGNIDEIAFALADKCCYCLNFRAVSPKNYTLDMTPKRKTVDIIRIMDINFFIVTPQKKIKVILFIYHLLWLYCSPNISKNLIEMNCNI